MTPRFRASPTPHRPDRRDALRTVVGVSLASGAAATLAACACEPARKSGGESRGGPTARGESLFRISLAQWSYHRAVQSKALDHLDFPRIARDDHGIDAVEYVSTLFDQGAAPAYVASLRKRCDDLGVRSLLIMIDGEGALGDPDETKRIQAVESHRKWLDAARDLGCHSIRVNAESKGGWAEQQRLAADGLRRLCERADPMGLSVILENHWGLSSNGAWVTGLIRRVGHPRFGTLPDFGNFDPKEYDRYEGVEDMAPSARAVSAKSNDFDDATGEETTIDYRRMLRIVLRAGYRGRVGIEYEGSRLPEPEGVRRTQALLLRIRDEFARGGFES